MSFKERITNCQREHHQGDVLRQSRGVERCVTLLSTGNNLIFHQITFDNDFAIMHHNFNMVAMFHSLYISFQHGCDAPLSGGVHQFMKIGEK